MASIQQKGDSYYCQFLYLGKRYTVTIGPVPRDEAEDFAGSVGQLLRRIKQKLIQVPAGVPITDFIFAGGQVKTAEEVVAPPEPTTLGTLRQKYLDTHRGGAMEANSLATVTMHLLHFERTLGEKFSLRDLSAVHLQRHIDERRKKKYRGKLLSPVTLRKEMASLRAAWNWGVHMGLVSGAFPSKGLVYPKGDEKPPFQTWQEIERKLPGLTAAEVAELWDCLFLTKPEVAEFLAHVKLAANQPWIYPAICFAAHTGARRSEVIRVKLQDLDLDAGTVLIREKKRARAKRTHRRVPLSPLLVGVLRDWLTIHPGGQFLFCPEIEVGRSKKRSRTTGHKGTQTRATTQKGRQASVRQRERPPLSALTKDEAHDHFQRTLAGSKWQVLKGWHVLRHSFISNCAAAGVDQRLIDAWVGHQTEEMRKRYRHLIPSTEQAAIRSVFAE